MLTDALIRAEDREESEATTAELTDFIEKAKMGEITNQDIPKFAKMFKVSPTYSIGQLSSVGVKFDCAMQFMEACEIAAFTVARLSIYGVRSCIVGPVDAIVNILDRNLCAFMIMRKIRLAHARR